MQVTKSATSRPYPRRLRAGSRARPSGYRHLHRARLGLPGAGARPTPGAASRWCARDARAGDHPRRRDDPAAGPLDLRQPRALQVGGEAGLGRGVRLHARRMRHWMLEEHGFVTAGRVLDHMEEPTASTRWSVRRQRRAWERVPQAASTAEKRASCGVRWPARSSDASASRRPRLPPLVANASSASRAPVRRRPARRRRATSWSRLASDRTSRHGDKLVEPGAEAQTPLNADALWLAPLQPTREWSVLNGARR